MLTVAPASPLREKQSRAGEREEVFSEERSGARIDSAVDSAQFGSSFSGTNNPFHGRA